jgi:hypothetical protein
MRGSHRYSKSEYERVEGRPLEPARLVAIWRSLDEKERFGFVLALDEAVADKVIELSAKEQEQA